MFDLNRLNGAGVKTPQVTIGAMQPCKQMKVEV